VVASQIGARDAKPDVAPVETKTSPLAGIPQRGAALGSPMAAVTLVEYADVQCPYCAEWTRQTLPYLIESYVRTGKIRIVFRGLAFLGPDSVTGLRALVAAGAQNRLWNLVEELYSRQGYENTGWVRDELAGAVASVRGLDAHRLDAAAASAATRRTIAANARAAERAGVRGTPTFEIGPTGGPLRVLSVQSLEPSGIVAALDDALAR